MSMHAGKPDVVELARAQLDFSAMNTAAPSAKDILFKAQTIVPMAPRLPWEKYAAGAGGALLVCAALALPWLPQQNLLSSAGVQFDVLVDPEQAQALVNQAVRGLSQPGQEALLSADYAPQPSGGGLLMLKATAFGEPAQRLRQRLEAALEGSPNLPLYASYQISESRRAYRRSPLEMLLTDLRQSDAAEQSGLHPAAKLAASVRRGEPLLKEELAGELLKHGYVLTGFAFAPDSALLPAGCQFTVHAWPDPVAVGVRGYLKLASYQQDEVKQRVEAWLDRNNLRQNGLSVGGVNGQQQPLLAEVLDGQGRLDSLLTARLNAAIEQPTPQQLADINFSMDQLLSKAANQILPGIERRVDFERVSRPGESIRYRARLTLLGRAEAPVGGAPDPTENSSVREEW